MIENLKNKKIAIYVPAFNAASTLPEVIDRIPEIIKDKVEEIFIIDNNSDDYTHLVVIGYKHLNELQNLTIIRNPENVGYGGSQKIAYRRCIEKKYAVVAMLHGDAQYAPELLPELIQPILDGDYDMIYGSRMAGDPLGGGMPLIRYLGNRFLTTLQNFFLGTSLSEFHSGYRVFSVDAFNKIPFEKCSSDFHFDTELIILFSHFGLRVGEISIPTHYGKEKNYVNIWKYGIDVLMTTFSYYLHKKKIRKSRNWSKILE
jgi:glycosyltransferase involved in cell wall biosynthesis